MDPMHQMAVQDAIDATNDPQVREALRQYRDSGVLPQNQSALTALSVSYLRYGLPAPTMAGATGQRQAGHSVDPNAPPPIAPPPPNSGDNSDPYAGARAGMATSAAGVPGRTPDNATPPMMAAQSLPATGAAPPSSAPPAPPMGGDNTDPYAPARSGAQGTDPNPALPSRVPTNAAPPTPALPAAGAGGGSTVSAQPPMPDPAAATGLGAQGLNTLYGDPTNQQGQQTALDQFLLSLGIDQNNPGLFGGALAKRLANVFMNTEAASGIGGVGKNWGTDALGGMADLANLIRTQGMGGVQQMGQQVMAALPGLAGANNSVADQQRLMNAALGLTSEGMNPYLSQGLAQQQSAAQTNFGRESAGAIGAGQAPPTNYLSFLASKQNPAYQGILNLLSGGR